MSVLTHNPVGSQTYTDNASTSSSLSSTRRQRLRSAMSRIFSWNGAGHASTVPVTRAPVSPDSAAGASIDANRASQINLLFETWEDWVDVYQRGTCNLSNVARPVCFGGFGYMPPPAHSVEVARKQAVSEVSAHFDWSTEKLWIQKELVTILSKHRLKMASVSLIDETCQRVHVSVNLSTDLFVICRDLSIDAHTILSKEYLALLDASSDWRSRLNPLVHGPPFLKFYLGVPFLYDGMPVGCIAVFDPYTRTSLNEELLHAVQDLAQKLSEKIAEKMHANLTEKLPANLFDPRRHSRSVDSEFETYYDVSSISQTAVSTDTCSTNTCDHHPREFTLSVPETSLSMALKKYSLPPKPRSYQQFQVLESLMKCRTLPHAVKKACQIVCRNLDASMVYVTEMRVGRNQNSRARLVGYYLKHKNGVPSKTQRSRTEERMLNDSKLLHAAVESQFGVQYISSRSEVETHSEHPNNPKEHANERSGILVPFRRSTESAQQPGAFIIAAFVDQYREFSAGDVVFTKKAIKALESIISVHEKPQGLQDVGY